MPRLVVIADDLTGALDTGVQFVKSGRSVSIEIAAGDADGAVRPSASDVVVVDTESRHAGPAEAGRRVEAVARRFGEEGAAGRGGRPLFYKKTDSTLRGNIGAELDGLMRALPGRPLVFVPAYPKLGRTTAGGIHFVNGRPVAETSFGRDPLNPVRSSSLPDLIAAQTARPVRIVRPQGLAAALAEAFDGILCVDASAEADLEAVAAVVRGSAVLPLLAGCAGFAAWLGGLIGLAEIGERPAAATTGLPRPGRLPEPVLLVNGSLNPASLGQLAAALKAGFRDVRLSPEQLMPPLDAAAETAGQSARRLEQALDSGKPAALRTILERGQDGPYLGRAAGQGWSGAVLHKAAAGYGRIVGALLERKRVGSLIVFGGDTLLAVLDALGRPPIVPIGELEPGVVLARLEGRDNPGCLVTKAGGFGDAELLLRLAGIE